MFSISPFITHRTATHKILSLIFQKIPFILALPGITIPQYTVFLVFSFCLGEMKEPLPKSLKAHWLFKNNIFTILYK